MCAFFDNLQDFQHNLAVAITNGDLERVRHLVVGSADIDKQLNPRLDIYTVPKSGRSKLMTIRGPTPLILAILSERIEIAKYFVEKKNARVDIPVNGFYPIHYAAMVGIPEVIKLVLDHSPLSPEQEANRLNSMMYSPLHIAAANEELQAVLLLLEAGANPMRTDYLPENGNTVLHVAMRNDDTKVAEVLLSVTQKSLLDSLNIEGEKPIDTAAYYNNSKMVGFLGEIGSRQILEFDELFKLYYQGPDFDVNEDNAIQ